MRTTSNLLFCLTILMIVASGIHAQNEANNWVFGNGVRFDFNSGAPVASYIPATIDMREGTSSISDSKGNLLFYTDGRKVWNRNNKLMHKAGTLLPGGASSTQSALIVPCGCNKYFIFTVGERERNYLNGFNYTIVDMTKKGGLGAVVSTTNLMSAASEKVAAVSDRNGGFWVVAHDVKYSQDGMPGNEFYSFHISAGSDCTLNSQSGVKSKAGLIYPGALTYPGAGQMKISPDGKRLAVAIANVSGVKSFVQLFQFDINTGKVSSIDNRNIRAESPHCFYGVEFSPDSQSLYATTLLGQSAVYRYDIANITSNPSNLLTPTHHFSVLSRNYRTGALQLGPDDNIYIASERSEPNNLVYVIDSPNVPPPGIYLTPTVLPLADGSQSKIGLPAMIGKGFSCRQQGCCNNPLKNWVFGNKALVDFTSGTPVPSVLPAFNTIGGSSSISDASGALSFYSNGQDVWDKTHNLMPNGTGLMGHRSSTQSPLIVPCGCNKYFIFTTGALENNFIDGFRYSIVDTTLIGGLGDVVPSSKNTLLLATGSEKLAGVVDGNGGFWVVTHGADNNSFFAYHIRAGSDCTLPDPVVSMVGTSYTGRHNKGQMKISPDGRRLAVTLRSNPGFVELFRFDSITGAVTDLGSSTVRDSVNSGFYGLEFSPNSRALYVAGGDGGAAIFRYDISSDTLPRTFRTAFPVLIGALQLATDGKIYVSTDNSQQLVINAPNASNGGLIGALFLAPGSSGRLGLPSMVAGDIPCGQYACCNLSWRTACAKGPAPKFLSTYSMYPRRLLRSRR